MSITVPTLSIVFMCVSLLISIGVPVGLMVFFRKKYKIKFLPVFLGAVAFFVSVGVLESIAHNIILQPDEAGNIALQSKPFLYMLYGGFMAGIFEETARFIVFTQLKKKKKVQGVMTGISYGIGHGGIEAILILSMAMMSNILVSVLINMGSPEILENPLLVSSVTTLAEIQPAMFLVGGFERIMAIAIQIALSVVVYYAVMGKGKIWLYPVAIVLHAVIDFPAALSQSGFISSLFLVELLVLVSAVVMVFIAWFIHKKFKETETNAPQETIEIS